MPPNVSPHPYPLHLPPPPPHTLATPSLCGVASLTQHENSADNTFLPPTLQVVYFCNSCTTMSPPHPPPQPQTRRLPPHIPLFALMFCDDDDDGVESPRTAQRSNTSRTSSKVRFTQCSDDDGDGDGDNDNDSNDGGCSPSPSSPRSSRQPRAVVRRESISNLALRNNPLRRTSSVAAAAAASAASASASATSASASPDGMDDEEERGLARRFEGGQADRARARLQERRRSLRHDDPITRVRSVLQEADEGLMELHAAVARVRAREREGGDEVTGDAVVYRRAVDHVEEVVDTLLLMLRDSANRSVASVIEAGSTRAASALAAETRRVEGLRRDVAALESGLHERCEGYLRRVAALQVENAELALHRKRHPGPAASALRLDGGRWVVAAVEVDGADVLWAGRCLDAAAAAAAADVFHAVCREVYAGLCEAAPVGEGEGEGEEAEASRAPPLFTQSAAGGGVLVVFRTVYEAASYCCAVQERLLAEERWPQELLDCGGGGGGGSGGGGGGARLSTPIPFAEERVEGRLLFRGLRARCGVDVGTVYETRTRWGADASAAAAAAPPASEDTPDDAASACLQRALDGMLRELGEEPEARRAALAAAGPEVLSAHGVPVWKSRELAALACGGEVLLSAAAHAELLPDDEGEEDGGAGAGFASVELPRDGGRVVRSHPCAGRAEAAHSVARPPLAARLPRYAAQDRSVRERAVARVAEWRSRADLELEAADRREWQTRFREERAARVAAGERVEGQQRTVDALVRNVSAMMGSLGYSTEQVDAAVHLAKGGVRRRRGRGGGGGGGGGGGASRKGSGSTAGGSRRGSVASTRRGSAVTLPEDDEDGGEGGGGGGGDGVEPADAGLSASMLAFVAEAEADAGGGDFFLNFRPDRIDPNIVVSYLKLKLGSGGGGGGFSARNLLKERRQEWADGLLSVDWLRERLHAEPGGAVRTPLSRTHESSAALGRRRSRAGPLASPASSRLLRRRQSSATPAATPTSAAAAAGTAAQTPPSATASAQHSSAPVEGTPLAGCAAPHEDAAAVAEATATTARRASLPSENADSDASPTISLVGDGDSLPTTPCVSLRAPPPPAHPPPPSPTLIRVDSTASSVASAAAAAAATPPPLSPLSPCSSLRTRSKRKPCTLPPPSPSSPLPQPQLPPSPSDGVAAAAAVAAAAGAAAAAAAAATARTAAVAAAATEEAAAALAAAAAAAAASAAAAAAHRAAAAAHTPPPRLTAALPLFGTAESALDCVAADFSTSPLHSTRCKASQTTAPPSPPPPPPPPPPPHPSSSPPPPPPPRPLVGSSWCCRQPAEKSTSERWLEGQHGLLCDKLRIAVAAAAAAAAAKASSSSGAGDAGGAEEEAGGGPPGSSSSPPPPPPPLPLQSWGGAGVVEGLCSDLYEVCGVLRGSVEGLLGLGPGILQEPCGVLRLQEAAAREVWRVVRRQGRRRGWRTPLVPEGLVYSGGGGGGGGDAHAVGWLRAEVLRGRAFREKGGGGGGGGGKAHEVFREVLGLWDVCFQLATVVANHASALLPQRRNSAVRGEEEVGTAGPSVALLPRSDAAATSARELQTLLARYSVLSARMEGSPEVRRRWEAAKMGGTGGSGKGCGGALYAPVSLRYRHRPAATL